MTANELKKGCLVMHLGLSESDNIWRGEIYKYLRYNSRTMEYHFQPIVLHGIMVDKHATFDRDSLSLLVAL
jgi:hypothetical protein